jgi:hypothetical protein
MHILNLRISPLIPTCSWMVITHLNIACLILVCAQNRCQHLDFLHVQMVSCNSIFFATASISVCFGSLQLDIDMEGQACAAMATALPQLQTLQGKNHNKSTVIISELYRRSSSSYQRILPDEYNTYIFQVTIGPL